MTVRYGIIGAGRMGSSHARHIRELKNTQITAVYDIRPEAAEAMHRDHGAAICASARELAERPDVDCVIVTSPTYCHPEGIRAAMAAGKAIFCEKALCRSRETADELLREVEAYDKLFTVGFVRRHMPKTILLRRLLAEGLIGKVRYCNIDLPLGMYRRQPGDWFADFDLCGGVPIDMLSHHIDLANLFFGDAERVYADGLLLSKELPRPSDYAAAVVTYRNGVICNMMCSWWRSGRSAELMEICGDEGTLVLDASADITYYPLEGEARTIDAADRLKQDSALDPNLNQVSFGNGFTQELSNLTERLAGNTAIELPTIRDAWKSLAVSFAIIDSIRSKSIVRLP